MRTPLFLLGLLASCTLAAQAVVKGTVSDARTREPLPFVNVLLDGTTTGATTDIEGRFTMENVKPGLYNVVVSSVGYQRRVVPEVQVGTARPVELTITLEPSAMELQEVEITRKAFERTKESPLSSAR
ncbi:MAG: carboxypeptidase-like regulatory domain-containing protein [Flavobacteriales bacterium]|nr:carboxypeptidase-like regulatory domain-containing protein [Flavobacteriales bacterium]